MEKYIEKTYRIEDDNITISLFDTRDSYIYPKTLGDIGSIYISLSGVFMCPRYDDDMDLEKIKERKLTLAFKEIFGTEEYNPLSPEYYQTIEAMIENGTLKSLGYEMSTYFDEDIVSYRNKRH